MLGVLQYILSSSPLGSCSQSCNSMQNLSVVLASLLSFPLLRSSPQDAHLAWCRSSMRLVFWLFKPSKDALKQGVQMSDHASIGSCQHCLWKAMVAPAQRSHCWSRLRILSSLFFSMDDLGTQACLDELLPQRLNLCDGQVMLVLNSCFLQSTRHPIFQLS